MYGHRSKGQAPPPPQGLGGLGTGFESLGPVAPGPVQANHMNMGQGMGPGMGPGLQQNSLQGVQQHAPQGGGPFLPKSMPQGMQQQMSQAMLEMLEARSQNQHGMPQGMNQGQSGMQYEMNQGHNGMPQGMPPNMSQGMGFGQQGMQGKYQGMQQNMSMNQMGMQQGMGPGMNQGQQGLPYGGMPHGMGMSQLEMQQQRSAQGMAQGHHRQQGMKQDMQQSMHQGLQQNMAQDLLQDMLGMDDVRGMLQGMQQQNMQRGMQQDRQQGMRQRIPQSIHQDLQQVLQQRMPQGMHQDLQQGLPQRMPQGMSEDFQQGLPQRMPQGMSEDFQQGMMPRVPQGMSEDYPQTMPQRIPRGFSEDFPQNMPQRMPQSRAEDFQQGRPQRMPQGLPEDFQQGMPQGMPQRMPQGLSQDQQGMSQGMPQGVPQGMTQVMPQSIPQDIPQEVPQPRQGGQQSLQQSASQQAKTAASVGAGDTPQTAPQTALASSTKQRPSRGGLASNTSAQSAPGAATKSSAKERGPQGRGVHFGEAHSWTPGDEQLQAASQPENGRGRSALLSEQLGAELGIVSPSLPASKAELLEEVLVQIHQTCQACAQVSCGNHMDAGDSGQLLPLGSYHLGVLQPGDEVDVLYVAPIFVQLSDFSAVLRFQLEQSDAQLMRVAGAEGHFAAPGLCFTMRGIDIKLLFAQRIPNLPLQQPQAMIQSTAGLLAREATENILAWVPDAKTFCSLLRFARHWARQRGIYGHYLGFLGGTAWAVCCARVCQLHPHLELTQLAARFFQTFSRWDWRQPVALAPPGGEVPKAAPNSQGQTPASGDGSAPGPPNMCILLPLEAPIPATPHLTDTTAKIIEKEFRRGYKMVQQVQSQRAHYNDIHQSRPLQRSHSAEPHWSDLYAPASFFQRHRHYLEFDFMASSVSVLAAWLTWGREQMQGIVRLFEATSSKLVCLRPWPEWIPFKDATWPHARAVFVGLHLKRNMDDGSEGNVRRTFDLREPIVKFLETFSTWPEASKHDNQFELLIRHVGLHELEEWLDNQNKGLAMDKSAAADQDQVHSMRTLKGPTGPEWTITEDDEALAENMKQCSV